MPNPCAARLALACCALPLLATSLQAQSPAGPSSAKAIDLPTSKLLLLPVAGDPQRLNSLPMSIAVSPDHRYVITLNAGYGTAESGYRQSLAVLDTGTGKLEDFPDDRTGLEARQTLYSGLAFSSDGRHVFASIASLTSPEGDGAKKTGSGVLVYRFDGGRLAPERMIHLPLQQLAPGHQTRLIGGTLGSVGVPYPAAIAVLPGAGPERLLIADNLSDDVLLVDSASGKVLTRFDLAENAAVPSTYPIALQVAPDGRRAFVALWNASEIVELDLAKGSVARHLPLLRPSQPITPGTHPCAFALAPDGRTLYVALSNRDAVAAVDLDHDHFGVKGYFDTRLPGQSYFGAEPEALAISPDGDHLYVADSATDAIAVLSPRKLTGHARKHGFVEPDGFVPTEWMPMSLALSGGKLYVATAKGKGTGPNNFPQKVVDGYPPARRRRDFTYIGTLLYGSLATLDLSAIDRDLKQSTAAVLEANRMKAAQVAIHFAGAGSGSRIKHVIYIIKENRTYDQILGDLEQNGHKVGNGDPSLTMYGEQITPNQHRLALQFGVLDNFLDSGEVSGDGHVWSNAAIGTDYLEKTWQQSYRGSERTYDFEGVVADGYPIAQHIPDVNEPSSGYLWGDLARHGKSLYHFGEYISSTFCNEKKAVLAAVPAQQGPMLTVEAACKRKEIKPGEAIPEIWGGGTNQWPWAIPLLAANVATKPELVGHFAPEQADFNLLVPDQIRANVFLRHLKGWVADRAAGHDTMPNFVMLRFPNDHTAGTRPGSPTPSASIADNDLAIGRAVEAVSRSPFWEDTAFFILEDDAQNGADHVDAHRSLALVVSKYAPHAKNGEAFVDSHFYSTVSMIRTMEAVLGLPPMNNNDAFASVIASEFSGPGDQAAFTADHRNEENKLIYQSNPRITAALNPGKAADERASAKMDFRHADRADARQLNLILWHDAKGSQPAPATLLEKHRKAKRDDDDD